MYHDVVKLCDAVKFMDCAFVQVSVRNSFQKFRSLYSTLHFYNNSSSDR